MALTNAPGAGGAPASPRGVAPDSVAYVGGVVGLLTAVVGLLLNVLGLIEIRTSKQMSDAEFASTIYLVITNAVFLIGISVALFAYRNKLRQNTRLDKENTRLSSELSSFQRVDRDISEARMVISYVHTEFCADLRRCLQRVDGTGVLDRLGKYLDQMLTHTAHLFSIYTGDTCAASIKMFSSDGGDQVPVNPDAEGKHPLYVYTLKRDTTSTQIRKDVDTVGKCRVYEYSKNAAFFYILDRAQHPDSFVSDNLPKLESEGKYWNENERWSRLYRATAVVPIRMSFQTVDEHCLGLLCVDNQKGGFDPDPQELHKERCVHILNGIAADLYYAIRTAVALAAIDQTGTAHG